MDFTTAFIQNILCTEVTANLQISKPYFHYARLESKYWKSVSTFGALYHVQYHSSEEIVYFSMDSNPDMAHYVLYTEVTANQQRRKRYFHCARLDSKYWNSVSTFGALFHFQYHRSEEIVYFSMDSNPDLAQNVLYTEVTANQQRRKQYFHCARRDSKYWNSVSTFGALLHFQYHISEEIFYFSLDFTTAFIQNILCTEVTANLQKSKPYFHCVRLDSKYWKSVSTFGALLHFQYHISEEILYFSMDFTIAFIQNVLCTEVTANLQRSKPCFHCVRLDSKYWKSVSTFGAHLYIQYHISEEIFYFSMDFTTAFIQTILCTEVTANLHRSKPYFHCVRLDSKYWNSVSTFGALLHFQYHISEEIFYFSMDFSTAFIQNILCTEVRRTCRDQNHTFNV